MKQYLTLAALALMATAATAQIQGTLTIDLKNGSQEQHQVSDIDKLNFTDRDLLHVWKADGGHALYNVKQVEQLSFSPADHIDLGGRANCYIVPQAGRYSFAATHVDGTPVEGIARATWLWRERSEEPLIADVSYQDGTVGFTAGHGRGNAVIAGLNAEGTVVWIWHIWLTERPAVMVYPGGAEFQDRNLGAVSAEPEDGRDTWGLTYQYGRNVPFYYIGDNQEYNPSEAFDQARKFTETNPELGLKWEFVGNDGYDGYDEAASMAHPMTHHLRTYRAGSLGGYHWASDAELMNLTWGNAEVAYKTNYDPCPKGYRVPAPAAFNDLKNLYWDESQGGSAQYGIPGFFVMGTEGKDQWWPMVCGRNYEDGCALYGGQAVAYPDRLFMWTSYADKYQPTPLTSTAYAPLRIIVQNDYGSGGLASYIPTPGTGSFSLPVRCVRDELDEEVAASAPAGVLSDVVLTLPDGSTAPLRTLIGKSPLTLVYFNNPDCAACTVLTARLSASSALREAQEAGRINVLSLYTDEDAQLWQRHVADYPASWQVARDAAQRILSEGLADLRQTPSLYLVDAEGRIILSDTSVEAVLEQLR